MSGKWFSEQEIEKTKGRVRFLPPCLLSSPPHWTLSWSSRPGRTWATSPRWKRAPRGRGWCTDGSAADKMGFCVNISGALVWTLSLRHGQLAAASRYVLMTHSVPVDQCQVKQRAGITVSPCLCQQEAGMTQIWTFWTCCTGICIFIRLLQRPTS